MLPLSRRPPGHKRYWEPSPCPPLDHTHTHTRAPHSLSCSSHTPRAASARAPASPPCSPRPSPGPGGQGGCWGVGRRAGGSQQVRLHDLAVPVVAHAAEGDDEQQQKVEGEIGHASARLERLLELRLHLLHLVGRVLLELRDDLGRGGLLLHPLLDLAQLVGLVVDRRAGDGHARLDRRELELHLLLQLVDRRRQRLERGGVGGERASVVPLHRLGWPQVELGLLHRRQRLLLVEPRLVVLVHVVDAFRPAHDEVHDVVVVDQVTRRRRDSKVAAARQLDVLGLEALVPLSVVSDRGLLEAQVEAPLRSRVGDVHARVVEHRHVLPRLVVPKVERAARVVVGAGQDLLCLVELLLRVGHVVLRAVVDHRVDVRVLVMVLLVNVLEGVEEDAEPRPIVLPAKHGPLDHVVRRREPDREPVPEEVLRLARRAQLHREAPLAALEGVAVGDPPLLRLLLRRQPHEPPVRHRGAAQLPVGDNAHAREVVYGLERRHKRVLHDRCARSLRRGGCKAARSEHERPRSACRSVALRHVAAERRL
mmetsp:Transcript_1566/g.4626  ORF Transcript_1566/g.4626 Transcript_1566/m.4626 type:complete len:537 (-) Transcript_1566:2-1612(-)